MPAHLEDIPYPLFLCAELNRVRRGYIETPSPVAELTFGIQSKRYAGRYHHPVAGRDGGRSDRVFRHKPHLVHGHWHYHLPKRMARSLTSEERVTWMLWEGSFRFEEAIELNENMVEDEIEGMVRETGCRPDWRYRLAPMEDSLRNMRARAGSIARSLVSPGSR